MRSQEPYHSQGRDPAASATVGPGLDAADVPDLGGQGTVPIAGECGLAHRASPWLLRVAGPDANAFGLGWFCPGARATPLARVRPEVEQSGKTGRIAAAMRRLGEPVWHFVNYGSIAECSFLRYRHNLHGYGRQWGQIP